jgi:hypothetical protein
MSTRAPRLATESRERAERFLVYVEGPRDRDVLRAWAHRLSPALARALEPACVILGGRQPARAAEHLARERAAGRAARGLCLLDGDLPGPRPPDACDGLELVTWRRRHIESYLLVPAAIERAARLRDPRLRRLLLEELPDPADERALAGFDAKAFLGRKGPLARFLGRPLRPGEIARAMRPEELAPEVRALLARVSAGLGMVGPEVRVELRGGDGGWRGEV